ncbi:MAG: M15 family metallopeptidase [Crocinitomicaceae bacterium]|nr:M15 family metallopeptidase [Crocinitomicaceae bacterium]
MVKFVFACLFFGLGLYACNNGAPLKSKGKPLSVVPTIKEQSKYANVHPDLVDIQQRHSKIQIDLKYTTTANFLGEKLYAKIDKAYLQKDVAERLAKVQKALERKHPGYQLLIYDALRPVAVQQKMWAALDSLPLVERAKFVSNPKNLSLHNMGAAIDLTILDAKGKPLDMGAGFDDIRHIAYPIYEDSFLRTGQLTLLQVQNRKLLRSAMQAKGFRQLPTEWWHYNACSRDEAKSKYKVFYTENDIFTTPTSN